MGFGICQRYSSILSDLLESCEHSLVINLVRALSNSIPLATFSLQDRWICQSRSGTSGEKGVFKHIMDIKNRLKHSRLLPMDAGSPRGVWITPLKFGVRAYSKINNEIDMTAGKLLHSIESHSGPISSLAFHPSEFLMASSSKDGLVRVFDLQTFECVSTSYPLSPVASIVQFSEEGHELFTASQNALKVQTRSHSHQIGVHLGTISTSG